MSEIIGYHVIFCTYGFWLPNDPRGSGSDRVWSPELQKFGEATKVSTRHSVAGTYIPPDLFQFKEQAKTELKYPAVAFTGQQATVVMKGFGKAVAQADYSIYACSIMPKHVHLVFGAEEPPERVVKHLRSKGTQALKEAGLWYGDEELSKMVENVRLKSDAKEGTKTHSYRGLTSPWAKGFWKVFIFDEEQLRAAVRYVEDNPVKEGKKPQHWGFVKQF